MSNQYADDKSSFIQLISKFINISPSKLKMFLEENNVSMVFEHPTAMGLTQQQLKKIQELKELSSLYNNLKDHKSKYCLKSSLLAGEYFKNYLRDIKDKEKFVCAFLDSSNNIIATEVISTGTVYEVPVYPREIIKSALMYDARSIIISHNHPGGSTNPSLDDINLTKEITAATETVGIKVLDHIIAAGDEFLSFKQQGLMPKVNYNSEFSTACEEEKYEEDAEI